jgi:hypothetical protein
MINFYQTNASVKNVLIREIRAIGGQFSGIFVPSVAFCSKVFSLVAALPRWAFCAFSPVVFGRLDAGGQ